MTNESERLTNEFEQIESKLKLINVKIDGNSSDPMSSIDKLRQMKTDFDFVESQLVTIERFTADLSHRTQQIDLIEDFQNFRQHFQRLKTIWKEFLRKTNENRVKFEVYSNDFAEFQRLINEFENFLNEIQNEVDHLTDKGSISVVEMTEVEEKFHNFLPDQRRTKIEQQESFLSKSTENLFESVENFSSFRFVSICDRCSDLSDQINEITSLKDMILERIANLK